MARFDDAFIQRMKDENDIVTLIESYGTKLKDRGNGEFIGLCPIHNDTSPSLVANRKKNVWNCLGACGTGGDPIKWVMHAEKVGFRHAMELLEEKAVGVIHSKGTKAQHTHRLESPIDMEADDRTLLTQIADYYHHRLQQSPDALDYLKRRGINDPQAIKQFKIGFCDRTLGLRLPCKQVKSGRAIRERLQTLGVLNKTGHERMRGCITFPFVASGGVGEIFGRRIDPKTAKKYRRWYLNGPHVGLWNAEAFQAYDEIILCESVIDALTFWCAGFRNVSTIHGTNGLTSDILDALKQHNIQRLILAYDNDEAGRQAIESHRPKFERLGIELFRANFIKDSDANDCFSKAEFPALIDGYPPAYPDLSNALRFAEWLGKGEAPEIRTPTTDFAQIAREQIAQKEAETKTAKQAAADRLAEIQACQQKTANAKANQQENPTQNRSTEEVGSDPSSVTLLNEPTSSSLAGIAGSLNDAVVVPSASKQPDDLPQEMEPAASASNLPLEAATSLTGKASPVASPVPVSEKEIQAEVQDNGIMIPIGNRTYRVRGLQKNLAFDVLKLNVMVRRNDASRFYVDTFDLYAARCRNLFVKEASKELEFDPEVLKRDLGKVLLKLEQLQDEQIQAATASQGKEIELTDQETETALKLLKQPNLIEQILNDFKACGVVGERTNKLVGYLATTSRKLDKPLAVMIQSSSAAGKSSLMEAVLGFIPAEEQVGYSAMTGQSLFYMGETNLQHKILSIAEEEGMSQAVYALKLLQSEGQLTIASTGKDPGTGRMETQEYHVEGPVMIFLTTTAIDIDEELLNRCVVLTVNEDRDQTRAIHEQQRKNQTLQGLLNGKQAQAIRRLHQNAQRLLRPLMVVNPYAHLLQFVDDCARRRRDHMKYLTLIQSIALLHQYQREIKSVQVDEERVQYIEVIPSDIVLANRLADQVLGKSIDELPPQTRRLLLELYTWVDKECQRLEIAQSEFRFTRRVIREVLGWGQTALKKHLERLLELEFVLTHRGSGRRIEYELLYDGRGREGQPTLCGLIDVNKLIDPSASTGTTNGSSPLSDSSSPLITEWTPQDLPHNTLLSSSLESEKPSKTQGEIKNECKTEKRTSGDLRS